MIKILHDKIFCVKAHKNLIISCKMNLRKAMIHLSDTLSYQIFYAQKIFEYGMLFLLIIQICLQAELLRQLRESYLILFFET